MALTRIVESRETLESETDLARYSMDKANDLVAVGALAFERARLTGMKSVISAISPSQQMRLISTMVSGW